MGVEDLWKHCVPGLKTKDQKHFKTAENKKIHRSLSYFGVKKRSVTEAKRFAILPY